MFATPSNPVSPAHHGPTAEPPAGQLRLASPSTANFTASLLHAAARLFPSQFFSTGGDELNTNCYDQDAETQQILNSTGQTLEQALSTFVVGTHDALRSVGKTPVVWEGASFKQCEVGVGWALTRLRL